MKENGTCDIYKVIYKVHWRSSSLTLRENKLFNAVVKTFPLS